MHHRIPVSTRGVSQSLTRRAPCALRVSGHVRPVRCSASPSDSLTDVLDACGLKPYQMDRLLRELERSDSTRSPAWLSARVSMLQAALGPDSGSLLADMLYNGGVDLLNQDLSQLPAQIVRLKNALDGAEVSSLVAKEPRLLWMSDIDTQIPKVLNKLVQIYPYKSKNKKADVIKVTQEYPELLLRMVYFVDDPRIQSVHDLPVDLQNRILRSYC